MGHTSRVVRSLAHGLPIGSSLSYRLAVAPAGDPVVLVPRVLTWVLLVKLRLQAIVKEVVGRLLDHSAAMRVPVRSRSLDEVLGQRSLLVLVLHL